MKHCETLDITKNEMDNNIFIFLLNKREITEYSHHYTFVNDK